MTKKITNHIKEARKSAGYSKEEISQKLKVNVALIDLWESGVCPLSIKNVIQLSDILKMSCHKLLISDTENLLNLENLSTEQRTTVIKLYRSLKKEGSH